MEYKYTLIFLRYQDEILLLNTNKGMWMGMWNGVGGKIEKGETPLNGALREVFEETGLIIEELDFKTIVTWEVIDESNNLGGMYIYYKDLTTKDLITPCYSPSMEGILDWKKIEWIFDERNQGIIKNIKTFLSDIVNNVQVSKYHCIYKGHDLLHIIKHKE